VEGNARSAVEMKQVGVDEEIRSIQSRSSKRLRNEESSLDSIVLGNRCEVFDDALAVWQGATLETYEDEEGKASVRLLHNNKQRSVAPNYVRPIKGKVRYDRTQLKIGSKCEARFSGDGKWYPASVLQLTTNGCMVEFDKYRTREEAAFEHIKIAKDNAEPAALPTKSMVVAEVPEHLRVKESDSSREKHSKEKALNKLRKETNKAKKDLVLDQKKQGWQAFQTKKKKKTKHKK